MSECDTWELLLKVLEMITEEFGSLHSVKTVIENAAARLQVY